MKIILGIGNPGSKYAGTRHNVGFMVLDRLAEECHIGGWKRRFHSQAAETSIAGERVLLLKPETYVNESGRALRAAVDWCHAEPSDVMVVLDDLNLELGRLRVRPDGRSGGHNGLESIIAHMGTAAVPRLRVGIGSAEPGLARDHVLSRFTTAEREAVDQAIHRAVKALMTWMEAGIERCQNEFNARPDEENGRSQRKQDKEADA